ncbi:MAG: hypothetical protein ACPGVB_02270, partial [Chitinophagales bacterium]
HRPPSTVHRPPSTVHRPPSSIQALSSKPLFGTVIAVKKELFEGKKTSSKKSVNLPFKSICFYPSIAPIGK